MNLGLSLGLGPARRGAPTPPADASVAAFYDPSRGASVATGAISALLDQSGTGDANKNLTAAGSNPTYNAADAAFGGRPSIQLSGTNRLDTAVNWAVALTQPFTIYIVGQITNNNGRLIDGEATGRGAIMRNSSSDMWAYYSGLAVVGGTVAASTPPEVVCGVFQGASSALYVSDFTTANVNGNPGTNGLKRVCLGALSGGGGEAGAGSKLAMAIVCSGAHNAALRALYRAYFQAWFGL